jgi:hypothetical protein
MDVWPWMGYREVANAQVVNAQGFGLEGHC